MTTTDERFAEKKAALDELGRLSRTSYEASPPGMTSS